MKRLAFFAALLAASGAFAQTAIDQNRALAGNVTPGDAPGFPVTLSQPGSYKLTGNLTVPAYTSGIVITAEDVTLDLNGFTVSGPGSCTQDTATFSVTCTQQHDESKPGIDARPRRSVVRNGTVKGFPGAGVLASTSYSAASGAGRYERLTLAQNAMQGFISVGHGSTVSHSVFDTNRIHGLYMSRGQVANSLAVNNGGTGLVGGGSALLITESSTTNNRISVEHAAVRGTSSFGDKGTRNGVTSLGGNVEGITPY